MCLYVFVCVNCTEVPQYLLEIVPELVLESADLSSTLKLSAKEKEELKVTNLKLKETHNQLREELEKSVRELRKVKKNT